MPEEIAHYLLGAQGGAEDDFACLYEVTNPVLLRYLRINTDADTAALALSAWATTLDQLKVCPPDDDAWLELVIGSARAAAAESLRGHAGASSADADAVSTDLDQVDHAIAVLRTCPPDEADVLSMGVVANLGREATSRLTGLEPRAVLDLVRRGQGRLEMSLAELIAALRVPGRPAEVAQLRLVAPLATAALAAPMPAAPATTVTAALVPGAAAAPSPEEAPSELSLVDLFGRQATAPAASTVVRLKTAGSATGTPRRSTRVGVAAATWLAAFGGVGIAASMSGLLTVALDALQGDQGRPPAIIAQAPVRPATPSPGEGSTAVNPPVELGSGSEHDGSPTPDGTQPAGRVSTGDDSTSSPASLTGGSRVVQIELASYVLPKTSTPPTPTAKPTAPATPATPPRQVTPVPRPGSGVVVAAVATPDTTKGNGQHHGAKAHHGKGHHGKGHAHHGAKAHHGKAHAHHGKGHGHHGKGDGHHGKGDGHHGKGHGKGHGKNRA